MAEKAFIVNPHAGNDSVGSNWSMISTLAKRHLGEFKTYTTTGPGDAVSLTKRAVSEGAGLIVCVGGDGTFNEVINGLMELEKAVRLETVLGFVPDGTGCDFVKTLPIPVDIGKAISLIASGSSRLIDVGRIVFMDHGGLKSTRYFHNIASMGLGGEVDRRVNNTTKRFGPFISFIWATLCSIMLDGKKKINLQTDQGLDIEINAWNVAVANGRYHGGGMLVAPDAFIDDGIFDVTVIGDLSILEVFLNLHMLYNGRIKEVKKITTFKVKKIKAVSEQRVLLDVDGEQPGMLPAAVNILPKALRVISNDPL